MVLYLWVAFYVQCEFQVVCGLSKVDVDDPTTFACLTLGEEEKEFVDVAPTWTTSKGRRFGNLVWINDLFLSNRQRIYRDVVSSVICKTTSLLKDGGGKKEALPTAQFQLIPMPADGRCGWRALIASSDLESFLRVPRTGHILACHATDFFFVYCIYIYLNGSPSGAIPSYDPLQPGRNQAHYPLNERQNAQEIVESKALCAAVCIWPEDETLHILYCVFVDQCNCTCTEVHVCVYEAFLLQTCLVW